MIFGKADHVEQIIAGTKTQTRRLFKVFGFEYRLGRTYGIRRCRTCRNIPEGRILIVGKRLEERHLECDYPISEENAKAEGGYTPEDYEALFEKMHPAWNHRYAYYFKFVPTREG